MSTCKKCKVFILPSETIRMADGEYCSDCVVRMNQIAQSNVREDAFEEALDEGYDPEMKEE